MRATLSFHQLNTTDEFCFRMWENNGCVPICRLGMRVHEANKVTSQLLDVHRNPVLCFVTFYETCGSQVLPDSSVNWLSGASVHTNIENSDKMNILFAACLFIFRCPFDAWISWCCCKWRVTLISMCSTRILILTPPASLIVADRRRRFSFDCQTVNRKLSAAGSSNSASLQR